MSPEATQANGVAFGDAVQRPLSPALRLYRFVNRPYYWYRPSQLARRLRTHEPAGDSLGMARTAWGSDIYCWADPLGRALVRTGVYDLIVAETLARLAEPGELVLDAGANIGFMSNLLARAVGPRGAVIAFEPHPLIFKTLAQNLELWRSKDGVEVIDARPLAVSSSAGVRPLSVDAETFARNKGTASLELPAADDSPQVRTVRLEDELGELASPVGVLKLDVEGHELEALKGAESLISRGCIRDIVFEEHRAPPTAVTAHLEARGYEILGVRQGLAGPVASAPADAYARQLWDPPALLATTDGQRARRRLRRRGWVCLGHGFGRRA